MKRLRFLPLLCLLIPLSASAARSLEEWNPLAVIRFGNIDAIDAEDGSLATFLKSIRNDGRFPPPMRTLVGPEIRNPTFFGIIYEAWIEMVLLAPPRPGPVESLWVFPVDNRDEYMTQLANQGLAEYEGMDGVTVLREMDQDGNIGTWHLEWLPGNVAVFGAGREAVMAARQIYAENSAARGLLGGAEGRFVEPDAMVRLFPPRIASWQDLEPGVYWWREKIERLARDLVAYWNPTQTRTRLINALTEELIVWPRRLERVDASVWFEERGVEWRLDVAGSNAASLGRSQLEALRRMPDRTAIAYAMPVTGESFAELGRAAGRLLLGGAGGAVPAAARETAARLFGTLVSAQPRQAAAAWVPAPRGSPELGGARLLLLEWARPEAMAGLWRSFLSVIQPDTPVAQVLNQLGWRLTVTPDEQVAGSATIVIRPAGDDAGEPYYDASFALRRNGSWMAIVGGSGRVDAAERRRVLAYRADMAAEAVSTTSEGSADARGAFVRMGSRGASFVGWMEPVRLMQLVLVEAADWRPRSPDQHEPLSTQLAREMLEYVAGGAWTVAGEAGADGWHFNGGMPWQSLSRLSGALGITEAIGME